MYEPVSKVQIVAATTHCAPTVPLARTHANRKRGLHESSDVFSATAIARHVRARWPRPCLQTPRAVITIVIRTYTLN